MIDPLFIVVDDDPISNTISKLTLEMVLGKIELVSFINPKEALDHIGQKYVTPTVKRTTLLLDINMPIMTGWEFLERFDGFDDAIKNYFDIYILSSSVDPRDKDRSYSNKNVKDYLLKPLTVDAIKNVMHLVLKNGGY